MEVHDSLMTINFKVSIIFFMLFLLILFSCSYERSDNGGEISYTDEVKKWHDERIKSLKKEDGWLSLSGLFWLKEGENSFGTASSNDIVFPHDMAPDFIGWFILDNGQVSVRIKSGIQVFHNDTLVTEMLLQSDEEGDPTKLTYGSLSWYVIKRGSKFGIRLKDSENPKIVMFEGIERYPVSPEWNIKAEFLPYDPPKKVTLPTVLGTVSEEVCPGALEFRIDGQTYSMDPIGNLDDDEEFFILFADQTNGIETYGAGRYLLVKKPDEEGITYIDFNKAYNPPCAFTKFATCPLPPFQNRLPINITAGEKTYKHALH